MRNLPTRVLVGIALVVVLVLAGGLSVYASDRPDGLQRVAEDNGFAQKAEKHATADGPLAGYETDDSGDPRVAGVVGALVVLVLATGTTYALRRRGGG
jgi:hypothetical protein